MTVERNAMSHRVPSHQPVTSPFVPVVLYLSRKVLVKMKNTDFGDFCLFSFEISMLFAKNKMNEVTSE
jgi:hypothetical protein